MLARGKIEDLEQRLRAATSKNATFERRCEELSQAMHSMVARDQHNEQIAHKEAALHDLDLQASLKDTGHRHCHHIIVIIIIIITI